MATVKLQNISKEFKKTLVVNDVSLEISSGEFFSIVGPSGCGKTTLLRMIAGFESPTSGTITLDGKDLTRVPPQQRSVGMVFQNYALFPHMDVYGNVSFGLVTKKIPHADIQPRVQKMLESVHLSEKIRTPVPNLSGGEQQRVAVARALIVEPSVILMDEPLSNLDVALRLKTREEIRALQQKTQITTIYVTHDQSEAMSLSDRIAVMRAGRLEQVGTPLEIYESPVSPFVAQFLGGANLLIARFEVGRQILKIGSLEFPFQGRGDVPLDREVNIAVKPEAIALLPDARGEGNEGVIVGTEYLGFTTNFALQASGIILRVTAISSDVIRRLVPGSKVRFRIDWSRCTFFSE